MKPETLSSLSPEKQLRELSRPSGAGYRTEGSLMSTLRNAKQAWRALSFAIGLGMAATACDSTPRNYFPGSAPDAGVTAPADDATDGGEPGDDDTDGGEPPPPEPDDDGDGIPNPQDVCRTVADIRDASGAPLNTDGDAHPNACDGCPVHSSDVRVDIDGDGLWVECDLDDNSFDPNNTDTDHDRVLDRDDNCEGFNPPPPAVPGSTPSQVDGDGDGSGLPCDCDDGNAARHPDAEDTPGDGIDSDCNGIGAIVSEDPVSRTWVLSGEESYTCRTSETRPDPVGSDTGACARGEQTCTATAGGTSFVTTTPGIDAVPETCNEVDDDCSGAPDDGIDCECAPDAVRDCAGGDGVCVTGTQTCLPDGTAWSEVCEGRVLGTDELCDGDDNDCDGDIDEDFGVGDPCTIDGACGDGVKECDGLSAARCDTAPGASNDGSGPELCDTEDNDCDGEIDEGPYGIVGAPGTGRPGTPCSMPGICGDGLNECAGDLAIQCNAVERRIGIAAAPEVPLCNEIDDDCDGVTDEGCRECVEGDERECGTSTGACNPGVSLCDAGVFEATCGGPELIEPVAETCNTVDDDCDGVVDNMGGHFAGQPCEGRGACGDGEYECFGVGGLGCNTMPGGSFDESSVETCDRVDNDCDGAVDEGVWAGEGAVGIACVEPGVCGAGVVECAGSASSQCSSLSRAARDASGAILVTEGGALCDGVDNNCNGAIDEGCVCTPNGLDRTVGSGTGVCEVEEQTCTGGVWVTTDPGVGPSVEQCGDGLDSDCDGAMDNGMGIGDDCRGRGECGTNIAGTPADEGLGVVECAAPGTRTTRCSVNPGGSSDQSSSEVCNGADDDCDGTNDDGIGTLGLPGSPCTLPGRCGDGSVRCDGLLGTECSSVDLVLPETCNRTNDDCDGSTDEGFVTETSCTLPGECGAGATRCTADGSATECSSIDRRRAEVAGNGLDDDCDASTDE